MTGEEEINKENEKVDKNGIGYQIYYITFRWRIGNFLAEHFDCLLDGKTISINQENGRRLCKCECKVRKHNDDPYYDDEPTSFFYTEKSKYCSNCCTNKKEVFWKREGQTHGYCAQCAMEILASHKVFEADKADHSDCYKPCCHDPDMCAQESDDGKCMHKEEGRQS